MTAPSSCKNSFFKEYLLYRLGKLKWRLVMSCLMSLLLLPYFSYGAGNAVRRFIMAYCDGWDAVSNTGANSFSAFFPLLCGAVLVVMALTGGPSAFAVYGSRLNTDLFGSLPLTHAERFWGDFLGGWIANVAPIVPAGIVSVIMAMLPNKLYDGSSHTELWPLFVKFIFGVSLSLFVACTVCYIVSTTAAVCCGRTSKSVLMSVVSAGAAVLLAVGIPLCVISTITGSCGVDYEFAGFFPALAALMDIFGNYWVLKNVDLSNGLSTMLLNRFQLFDPLYALYTAAFSAGLTATAFYLSKSRRPERTGDTFVYNGYFVTVLVIALAGDFMAVLGLCLLNGLPFPLASGLAAAAGVPAAIILEIIRRPRVRELAKTLIVFVLTAAFCMGAGVLLNKTGSFGRRYLSAEGAESVEIRYSLDSQSSELLITDKNDIETLTVYVNDVLKEHYRDIRRGYACTLCYKYSGGGAEYRELGTVYGQNVLMEELVDTVRALPTYAGAQADMISDSSLRAVTAHISSIYAKIELRDEAAESFGAVFAEELREKYSPDTAEAGKAWIIASNRDFRLDIPENFTRSIEYLMSYAELSEDDLIMTVRCPDQGNLTLRIFRRDLEKDEVKELISLLTRQNSPDGNSDISVEMFDSTHRYVPKNYERHVTEILFKLAGQAAE